MCPTNRIGTVDVYLTSHHGLPKSNAPALVHALQPRVAVMNNGTRKGGEPDAFRVLYDSQVSRIFGNYIGLTTWASTIDRQCSSQTWTTTRRSLMSWYRRRSKRPAVEAAQRPHIRLRT
jgi:hypothetical protein